MIKKEKNILLTFDYELFFKKAGTIKNCIIKPTENLIKTFDRYNIKSTFFIDALYYIRLKENKATNYEAGLLKNQIQELVSKGHRVELHLHPHWLDAVYEGNEWSFPTYKSYRLHNLPESKITDLFVTGAQVLESIARECEKNYKVIAFRAGGWCIQPFNLLLNGFKKSGLKIDSTLAYGFFRLGSEISCFDFRNMPNKPFYRFSDEPTIEDKNGSFYEIPITTYKPSFYSRFIRRLERKKIIREQPDIFRIYGDGEGMGLKEVYGKEIERNFFEKIKNRFLHPYVMYSLQGMFPEHLNAVLKDEKKRIINFLSHPKGIAPIYELCIDKMVDSGYNFIELYQLYNYLEKN